MITLPKLVHGVFIRPLFVRDNCNSIHDIAKNLHWTYGYIARSTGIPEGSISNYAAGIRYPDKERYNKLAAFFDWEVWP